jgi:hypothetical protein
LRFSFLVCPVLFLSEFFSANEVLRDRSQKENRSNRKKKWQPSLAMLGLGRELEESPCGDQLYEEDCDTYKENKERICQWDKTPKPDRGSTLRAILYFNAVNILRQRPVAPGFLEWQWSPRFRPKLWQTITRGYAADEVWSHVTRMSAMF